MVSAYLIFGIALWSLYLSYHMRHTCSGLGFCLPFVFVYFSIVFIHFCISVYPAVFVPAVRLPLPFPSKTMKTKTIERFSVHFGPFSTLLPRLSCASKIISRESAGVASNVMTLELINRQIWEVPQKTRTRWQIPSHHRALDDKTRRTVDPIHISLT